MDLKSNISMIKGSTVWPIMVYFFKYKKMRLFVFPGTTVLRFSGKLIISI